MSQIVALRAKVTTAVAFPDHFFLENLVMRSDQSLLTTVVNRKEVWYVPPVHGSQPPEPALLVSFEQSPSGIIEAEPNVFLVCASNLYTSHEAFLYRLDLRNWKPGTAVKPELMVQFPESARSLNCSCMIGKTIMLASDGFGSRIWRVDFDAGDATATARIWLEHESMGYFPGSMKPEQPGVNGLRYAAKTNTLYFTSTAKKLVMRVATTPDTFEPSGDPEVVATGRMSDDFCIDEDAQLLYLASHRENTIDCISMDPSRNGKQTLSVAGEPFNAELIGPTSGVWGRGAEDNGKVAYFTTEGGIASPPPGMEVQPAKILRVELK